MSLSRKTSFEDVTAELVPKPSLQRMPWYLAYVGRLRLQGVANVTSTQLSRELNVDASQIAKDLSYLNVRGKTRIGYDVASLDNALADFLGFRRDHAAVIFGVGSLGGALLSDRGLEHYGLNIVAGFDIDSAKINPEAPVPVYDVSEHIRQISRLQAEIAILTVPHAVVQEVADMAVAAGIRALWNFTPHKLLVPRNVVVQDTSLYSDLALIYNQLIARK